MPTPEQEAPSDPEPEPWGVVESEVSNSNSNDPEFGEPAPVGEPIDAEPRATRRRRSRRAQPNQFRRALDVLNQGRAVIVDRLADEILESAEDFAEGGFLFQEFLESRGPRFQFYSVLAGFLEHAAELAEDAEREREDQAEREASRQERRSSEDPQDRPHATRRSPVRRAARREAVRDQTPPPPDEG